MKKVFSIAVHAGLLSMMAAIMTSCATTEGPREVRIRPNPFLGPDPDVRGTVDFQRLLFVADIHGDHFVASLTPGPKQGSWTFQPRSSGGVMLSCYLSQLLPDRWTGQCEDSSHRVVLNLEVGSTFHI